MHGEGQMIIANGKQKTGIWKNGLRQRWIDNCKVNIAQGDDNMDIVETNFDTLKESPGLSSRITQSPSDPKFDEPSKK